MDKQVAEDLAHEAFLTAMDKSGTYRGTGEFDAWIRKITLNTALLHLRERKNKTFIDTGLLKDYSENENEDMNGRYDFSTKELLDEVNKLPEHHRLVFNLYVIDKISHKQIAERLSISENTSKSHLLRARKKLQEALSEKSQEKDRKRAFIWLILPWKFRSIDRIYSVEFKNFKLHGGNTFNFNASNFATIKMPVIKTIFGLTGTASIVGGVCLAIVTIGGILVINHQNKPIEPVEKISNIFSDTLYDHKKEKDSLILEPDTNIKTEETKPKAPVVIKKKKIKRKVITVRDTLRIVDTSHAK